MDKKTENLIKASIVLSIVAALICAFFLIFDYIKGNTFNGIWIIALLTNISILLANYTNLQNSKTPAKK